MLESFRIAFQELRQETALLYLHLNETACFPFPTVIRDRLGRSYPVDLDATAFVLQEKKPLMMPAFQVALEQGDREEAKRILHAFLHVVAARAEKGIFNKDPSFLKNFAYDEGKGIQIDIGSFYRKKDASGPESFAPSFLQTVGHVQEWLNGTDPAMAEWFKEQTAELAAR